MSDADTQDLSQPIRDFVERRFPLVKSQGLDNDANLLDGGAIDSMGLLDVVGFLEERFGIEVDDDDLAPENFQSITDLARFVESKSGGV